LANLLNWLGCDRLILHFFQVRIQVSTDRSIPIFDSRDSQFKGNLIAAVLKFC
jgi:hypothetical protein